MLLNAASSCDLDISKALHLKFVEKLQKLKLIDSYFEISSSVSVPVVEPSKGWVVDIYFSNENDKMLKGVTGRRTSSRKAISSNGQLK